MSAFEVSPYNVQIYTDIFRHTHTHTMLSKCREQIHLNSTTSKNFDNEFNWQYYCCAKKSFRCEQSIQYSRIFHRQRKFKWIKLPEWVSERESMYRSIATLNCRIYVEGLFVNCIWKLFELQCVSYIKCDICLCVCRICHTQIPFVHTLCFEHLRRLLCMHTFSTCSAYIFSDNVNNATITTRRYGEKCYRQLTVRWPMRALKAPIKEEKKNTEANNSQSKWAINMF